MTETATESVREPADELRSLCYGGETLERVLPVGSARVGITTHRLLVLDPDGDETRFRAVDRPNVLAAEVATEGGDGARRRAIRYGVYAVGFLAAGAILDLGGVAEPGRLGSGPGLGGVTTLVRLIGAVLGLLDDVLVVVGGAFLLAAALFVAWYVYSRERYLEVGVAGDVPVRLPGDAVAAERLDTALDEAWPSR